MSKRMFNRMVNFALYGQTLKDFENKVLKGEKVEGIDKYWQYAKQVAYGCLRG